MAQLFDILHPDFFKPLAGIHRQKYADIITLIWDRCKRSADYGEGKSILLNWLEEYFDGLNEEISFDPEDIEVKEDSDTNNSRFYAAVFLRRLKATGWVEEREGGYAEEPQIVINHRIIPVIRSLQSIIAPKMVAYKGKLFKIYKLLASIDESESPYESVLREVSNDLDELNIALRQLASSIGTHIDELTRGKTPDEVLRLFDYYEEQIVVGAYHRFKTNDNLFYYRTELITQLDLCRTQYFEKLVNDFSVVEQTPEDESAAAILSIIFKIQEDLKEMGGIMRAIDENHILYRSRAVQRAQFLLLSDGTVKGKINQILQYLSANISSAEDLWDFECGVAGDIFQIFPQSYFDSGSIKPPITKKIPTPVLRLEDIIPIDEDEALRRQELLMQYVRNAVTAENVNLFAEKVLSGKPSATAEALVKEYRESDDIVKIIGLHTYSTSDGRAYDVVMKQEYIEYRRLRFQNFIVHKKG